MVQGVTTRQRSVSYYIGWFHRVYQPSDAGWQVVNTPDGKPITEQDAFFWFALEIIGRELNIRRALEIEKMSRGT